SQPSPPPHRPTPAELRAARNKRVPDVIAPRLKVLFVGINPGLYSAAVRHHFARPGNRFWPALQRAGLTPRLFSPYEERELLKHGLGITNIVNRASAAAAELGKRELASGGKRLTAKIARLRPRIVAFLGIDAYRSAFGAKRITVGPQPQRLGGAVVWVLPNPSGLNAHYQLTDFVLWFRRLRTEGHPHGRAPPHRTSESG
ncbi:MAG TPA: G/U mismatch-specific DNA glycosylase, partial [Acidiferrobacterales bacterium]|nr:G/U mismatch-specific DNA glycosylase [Acidiferrobacterales bacterium]